MKIIFLILVLLTNSKIFGQDSLNTEQIKKKVLDSSVYKSLIDQFNHTPSKLDNSDGITIYYGKSFRAGYKPFKINFDQIDFIKLIEKRKYRDGVEKGEKLLSEDPVNLEILLQLFFCYNKLKAHDLANLTKSKIDLLVASILIHGAGESKEHPLKVLSVGDEYAIMDLLGITGISRTSEFKGLSTLDIWKAKNSDGKRIDFFVDVLYYLEKPASDN